MTDMAWIASCIY